MTDMQATILRAIDAHFGIHGFLVGDIAPFIARQPGHESNRQHSALISRELRALEKAGLVCRLDDLKPVVWGKPVQPNESGI